MEERWGAGGGSGGGHRGIKLRYFPEHQRPLGVRRGSLTDTVSPSPQVKHVATRTPKLHKNN